MARLLRSFLFIISVLVLAVPDVFAQVGEQLTITTYYPSPYGSYGELTAYSMKVGINYSGSGIAATSNNLIVEGNVGIGNSSPTYQLDVTGQVNATSGYRVGALAGFSGTLRSLSSCSFTAPSTLSCDYCDTVITNGIITGSACT